MNTPTRCWAHVAHTQRLSPEWMWAGDLDEWGVGCVSVSPKGVCLCVYQSSHAAALVGLVNSRVQEFRNSTSVFLISLEIKISIRIVLRVCRISEFLDGSFIPDYAWPL